MPDEIAKLKPKWPHDCDKCTFVNQHTVYGTAVDVYTCAHTVLIRYGKQPHEYWSMPLLDNAELRKDLERAVANGQSTDFVTLALETCRNVAAEG